LKIKKNYFFEKKIEGASVWAKDMGLGCLAQQKKRSACVGQQG